MKAIAGIIALLVTMPIWFFLLYRVLDAVNASELTWFLYWIYVPATILVNTLTKLAEDAYLFYGEIEEWDAMEFTKHFPPNAE